MRWPEEFHALRAGDGCPACAEGRPDATEHGVRWLTGEQADAYARRAGDRGRAGADPRPGWPFPFPDPDPGPMSDDRLMADIELLKAAVR